MAIPIYKPTNSSAHQKSVSETEQTKAEKGRLRQGEKHLLSMAQSLKKERSFKAESTELNQCNSHIGCSLCENDSEEIGKETDQKRFLGLPDPLDFYLDSEEAACIHVPNRFGFCTTYIH